MKVNNTRIIIALILLFFSINGPANGSELLSLSLDEAVSMALEENLQLKLSKNEVAVGQGAELIEKGAFDPYVEAGVSGLRQRMTSLLTNTVEEEKSSLWTASIKKKMITGTEVGLTWENGWLDTDSAMVALNPSYSSAISVSIFQPLLRGNNMESQTAGIRAAAKYTEAVTYMVEDQAAVLAAEVKKAYWELVYAHQEIEVKRLSLELARNLRDETLKRIEDGVLAQVEIYQPEAEIALREELLITAEKRIANAEDGLKMLINSSEWSVSLIPTETPAIDTQKPDLEEVLNRAMAGRPDVMASDLQVNAARVIAGKAEDDLKPSLALGGSAGMNGLGENYGDTVDNAVSGGSINWQVGLTFTMPIGNRTRRGGLATAKAELTRAKYRKEQLRQEVVRNSREAVRNVTLSLKTIEATRKTSIAAQKRLEAEKEKFDIGMATANDVLEYQDSYARALIGEKRALIDLARARADLDRVQGVVSLANRQAASLNNST